MKLSKDDTRYLRASIVWLVLGLCVCAAAASASYLHWQDAQKQQKAAQNADKEIRNKLALASKEEQELKEKISRYLALKQAGVLGDEKRLDWVEQLALIRRDRKLADLQYELTAQHPAERTLITAGPNAGGHQFYTSTLKLTASLLHEGDLIALLDDIKTRLSAIPSVRECLVDRRQVDERAFSLSYGLKGECTLELLTIKEPGA
jgi:hypothetical protein